MTDNFGEFGPGPYENNDPGGHEQNGKNDPAWFRLIKFLFRHWKLTFLFMLVGGLIYTGYSCDILGQKIEKKQLQKPTVGKAGK